MSAKEKPVVFVQGDTNHNRQNLYAQQLILKALSEGVSDVNELRKLAGMKSAAEVYRTLDKMAIRREYHEALATAGVSLQNIVEGIRDICYNGATDGVKLKGFQVLLRSLGLDKYEKQEDTGKSWEEVLMKAVEEKEKAKLPSPDPASTAEYAVVAPAMPDYEAERRKEDKKFSDELYGSSK